MITRYDWVLHKHGLAAILLRMEGIRKAREARLLRERTGPRDVDDVCVGEQVGVVDGS